VIVFKRFCKVIRRLKNIFRKSTQSGREAKLERVAGGFVLSHIGLTIYSNSKNALRGTFLQIFEEKIYDFECEAENPVIIDAGANIGLAALFWKTKFKNPQITCFEPSRVVYDVLLKNLAANNFADVRCINKALSNQIGKVTFTSNEDQSGSLVMEKNLEFNYEVETDLLSKYIVGEVDLLKLDIEGAELDVLLEAKERLTKVKRLFVEYHSFVHRPQQLSLILGLLEELNFRYYMEGEYKQVAPLTGGKVELGQDMKINIWARNVSLIGG
jgi:FkbM family methyltransferase